MCIKTYIELAKDAGHAEREGRWQDAYQLWSSAQNELTENHINKFWAETRAAFCQNKVPKPLTFNPFYSLCKTKSD
ncbi:TPA: ANR family transcriptional regulator [Vibrio parahaemolyticus]